MPHTVIAKAPLILSLRNQVCQVAPVLMKQALIQGVSLSYTCPTIALLHYL